MKPDRLDALIATLASSRPVLDDLSRARVGAALGAACRTPAHDRAPEWRRGRRRWVAAGVVAAAAAIALAISLDDIALPGAATAQMPGSELPGGALLLAAPGSTARGQIDGTSLTIYGAGRATRSDRRLIIDADAFVVERAADEPVELQVRDATIRLQQAAFAAHNQRGLHVTVIRGDILLRCDPDAVGQTVAAGGSASCGPVQAAAGPPAHAGAPPRSSEAALLSTTPGPLDRTGDPSSSSSVAGAAEAAHPEAQAAAGSRETSPGAASAAGEQTAVRETSKGARAAAITLGEMPAPVGESQAAAKGAPGARLPAIDPAARYAAAERLMAADPAGARAALRALVAEVPSAPEAAAAWLDIARLAAATGDEVAAHAALNHLAAHPAAASLAMPAAYLRCQLAQAQAGYRSCLAGFRAAFPDSPRDADALGHLAITTARAGDCAAALPLLVEYLRRYAAQPGAAAVQAWRARCGGAAR